MQILLANAKIMFGKTDRKPLSTPLFQTTADMLAAEMAKMNMVVRGIDADLGPYNADTFTSDLHPTLNVNCGQTIMIWNYRRNL